MVARASGDLLIFPGLTETFENLVREAMASGLPVVALGDAAAPSLIDPWRNGFTLREGYRESFIAAGCEVARDSGRLRQPDKEARKAAEGISWDPAIRGIEERLCQVLHRQPGTEVCRATVATTSK